MSRRTATAYRFWRLLRRSAPQPSTGTLANDSGPLYGGSMADPSDSLPSEVVRRAADERIRLEAIRQLDSVDLDDPDPRMEPLPRFESVGLFERSEKESSSCSDSTPEEEWDEIQGRFVPSGDDGCSRRSS